MEKIDKLLKQFLKKYVLFGVIGLIILVYSLLYIFDAINSQNSNYQIVSVEEFKALIKQGHPIIDVRRPDEFIQGSIPNAVNFNVLDSNFIRQIDTLDKTKPYLIHCRSGNRSKKAIDIMIDLGFERIYDLEGGYLNWVATDSLP
ncbi:MAG: rhodanese-like domain-containing protein [Flavobacteriaceae bacterium]|nr:rhodanese-like domain-containing protein [Flavobacteriaceae bacterium]MCY4217333.1 rhodanese-like domain-containing protein [Flavobacteriaceae bacterium]MCY4254397.1 rhodanese-like domain-containing protein [Flavobacteriaceae bacterium]